MDTLPSASRGASQFIRTLARELAAAYVSQAAPRAILLTGSAAEGTSDYYSDLDVVVYYDGHLPNDAQLASARQLVNASDFRARAPRSDDAYVEEYAVRGVACEILHTTVAAWELQMAAVLQDVSKLNSGPSGRLSSRGPAA